MSLDQLISEYGYLAIFIGTFFEGETILVLGGFAAHRGYLDLPWVVLCAFSGTLLGDQLYFYLGRHKGLSLLNHRPQWRARTERARLLLQKNQVLLILGFRFVYGIRTVTPIMIGMSEVPPLMFLILNIIGGAIWAVTIGVAGYLFGQSLELFFNDLKRYELWVFLGIIIVAMFVWGIHYRARSKRKANASAK